MGSTAVSTARRCPYGFERKKLKMKLIHLSDLHLGKRVNECSMLEDQQYIL